MNRRDLTSGARIVGNHYAQGGMIDGDYLPGMGKATAPRNRAERRALEAIDRRDTRKRARRSESPAPGVTPDDLVFCAVCRRGTDTVAGTAVDIERGKTVAIGPVCRACMVRTAIGDA
jgi:hypothetical protein